jgi:hypothetical protein
MDTFMDVFLFVVDIKKSVCIHMDLKVSAFDQGYYEDVKK